MNPLEEIVLDFVIGFCATTLLYCLYVLVVVKLSTKSIRSEYLTETVINEIKGETTKHLIQIERRLNAKSMIYIDKNFNRLNDRIERLINNRKT
ncbi:hypothetical protein [Aureispira sp. CCB-QB1]|uniref:hypothetical protein n=1 Tax=Aureispira sp. CCB-QB1 TaxID=1313421 RepID=UPI000695EB2B|nr:hypothetical protein [Aureispira sp. CCB-QB1]